MEELLRDQDIERAYRALKAMSHPLRLKILCALGESALCVQEIVQHIGTSQSNVSQHLLMLHDNGMLASCRKANRVFYHISDHRILQLIGAMHALFSPRLAQDYPDPKSRPRKVWLPVLPADCLSSREEDG